MITWIMILLVISILFGVGFTITGALLRALLWLCICVPVAVFLVCLGIICCCTIILIPIGIRLFGAAISVLIPG